MMVSPAINVARE